MARVNKGILDGFSGKVGTVIGGRWKGIEYMRSRGGKRTKDPTPKQLAHQAKFSLVSKFIQPLANLFMVSYKDFANSMTGINSAFSYAMNYAVVGNYPSISLDYSLMLISRGNLPNVQTGSATSGTNGKIDFTWADNSGVGKALPGDKCVVVIHCPALNQSIFAMQGAQRNAGAFSIDASRFSNQTVKTWLAFISADESDVAASIYTGSHVVS